MKVLLKECSIHGEVIHRWHGNSKGSGTYVCPQCVWVREKQKKRDNKLRAIEYLGGKCVSCGSEFPGRPEVFDIHHLDPSKKDKSPAAMFNCSWEYIMKELDKCVLLCSNCHRTEHARIRDKANEV